jgi:hypothetical protein
MWLLVFVFKVFEVIFKVVEVFFNSYGRDNRNKTKWFGFQFEGSKLISNHFKLIKKTLISLFFFTLTLTLSPFPFPFPPHPSLSLSLSPSPLTLTHSPSRAPIPTPSPHGVRVRLFKLLGLNQVSTKLNHLLSNLLSKYSTNHISVIS